MSIQARKPINAAKTPAFAPLKGGLLQRKCACGSHAMVGGECEECAKQKSMLQRKLAIGASNDPLEQEADRVADQVMSMSLSSKVSSTPPHIQRFSGQESEGLETVPSSVSRVIAGSGRPLEAGLRQDMEWRFGHDFSQVRAHTGSAAEQSARDISANAYTVGNNVVFGAGRFQPGTQEGQRLVAHELTHVVQQSSTDGINVGRSDAKHGLSLIRAPVSYTIGRSMTSTAATYTGVIRRQPNSHPVFGSAVDQVMQALAVVNPVAGVGDFPAAFRILDSLPVDELLAALTDLERRFQLDLLIANSGSAVSFNQVKLVTAMQVVRQSHGVGANLRAAHATIAASGLSATEQFAMTNYLLQLRPAVSTTHGADQRAPIAPGGTAVFPSADMARELGYELDPSSRSAPLPLVPATARVPWDGRTGAPGATTARATMQTELFAAFDAYLMHFRPSTVAALARPRVAITAPATAPGGTAPAPTGVVDIANQARGVLERRYATSMDAAATTPAQLSDRGVRQASGPGQNIFDMSSEAERATLTGSADLAPGVAWWLFENDTPGAAGASGTRRFATDILAAHHYSTQDSGAEQFRWEVANAYAAASTLAPNNRRQLIDYRMTGWSERGSRGITLQSSFDPGADRNRAELAQRWDIFKTATHESLHLRAHPAFVAAEQGRGTMKEGFVEMFTIATLNTDVLPRVRAGNIEPLRRTVEGALSPASPDAAIITNSITPAQYAPHRAQAERIRDGGTPVGGVTHVGIGEAAVRAAFFQGHIEYLGLAPTGSQLTILPAIGAVVRMRIPSGITGLDELARRSGVPRVTIERDNPGITDALPATAVLTGCREHWVVVGETRANIAAQNGVSEVDLVRANPDIPTDVVTSAWPALTIGQKILIPVH